MITVKDLQELLSTYHPDDVVVLASDEEGNSFSPLAQAGDGMYHPNAREVQIKLSDLTPAMQAEGFSEEDVGTPEEGYVPCVVFWPTH